MKFDKIVDKIVGMGIPGLVLLLAMAFASQTGAAAISVALATLGGPFGMLGGIGLLVFLGILSNSLAEHGIEKLGKAVIERMIRDGLSTEEIKAKIASYIFLSNNLKRKMYDFIDSYK